MQTRRPISEREATIKRCIGPLQRLTRKCKESKKGEMMNSSTNVQGVVIKGSVHWLMEEAPGQVIPQLVAFINKFQVGL